MSISAACRRTARKIPRRLCRLREADALAHVVRLFDDPAVPHEAGSLDAMRDIESVDIELILNDLEQAAKRIERVEKDLKKKKDTQLEAELEVLMRCRQALEAETAAAGARVQAGRTEDAHGIHVPDAQAHAVRAESGR